MNKSILFPINTDFITNYIQTFIIYIKLQQKYIFNTGKHIINNLNINNIKKKIDAARNLWIASACSSLYSLCSKIVLLWQLETYTISWLFYIHEIVFNVKIMF